MLSIECDPPRTSRCDCCGGETTHLTRFVYRDGDAYAAYRATFSDNHSDGIVSVLIGIGEWGDGTSPDDRAAFAAQIRVLSGEFQVMLVDGPDSIWTDVAIMGRLLSRADALAHPRVSEVFDLTDHIVHEDKEVHAYLAQFRTIH